MNDKWWWPVEGDPGSYWPIPVDPIDPATLDQFVKAFESIGYIICFNILFENGFEKVAIYVDSSNAPTHASRMLPDGLWTSKLGRAEDISHKAPNVVEGKCYGKAIRFLKRPNDSFIKSLFWRLTYNAKIILRQFGLIPP